MQCPNCSKYGLSTIEIATNLHALQCQNCSGIWIRRNQYDSWLKKQSENLPTKQPESICEDCSELNTKKARICPDCKRLMLPYRVGHGIQFTIDYCGTCGGIWLDKNEWDIMKRCNLHDNLCDIVSPQWQAAINKSKLRDSIENRYKQILGNKDYDKLQEVRNWIHSHPQKSLIIACLND